MMLFWKSLIRGFSRPNPAKASTRKCFQSCHQAFSMLLISSYVSQLQHLCWVMSISEQTRIKLFEAETSKLQKHDTTKPICVQLGHNQHFPPEKVQCQPGDQTVIISLSSFHPNESLVLIRSPSWGDSTTKRMLVLKLKMIVVNISHGVWQNNIQFKIL